MTPTIILKDEHRIVLHVLEATLIESVRMNRQGIINIEKLRKIVAFAQGFIDLCHHTKEEKHYFEKMIERGMLRDSGPIYVMMLEHEEGRKRISLINGALDQAGTGDAVAIELVSDALKDYADNLREHIYKEDNVLYPMGDRLFTREDVAELMEAFERVDKEQTYREKYQKLAKEIAEE
jgi:hemerythrin-like domain-containing protein